MFDSNGYMIKTNEPKRIVAARYSGKGGPESIEFEHFLMLKPSETEVLVEVHASALNRADILQRDGLYSVKPEQSTIPGIEIAGYVVAKGSHVTNIQLGDRVCGIVSGGGFASHCLLDEGMAISIPKHWSFEKAAAFSEAAVTADEVLMTAAHLSPGNVVLLHAAGSGMGTMMIKMIKLAGASVICTTNSPDKVDKLKQLGADHVILPIDRTFSDAVLSYTNGKGIDLVVDFIGGDYLNQNFQSLRPHGKIIFVGLLGDNPVPVDFIPLINKRISLKGTAMRIRTITEKRKMVARFKKRWWHAVKDDKLNPVIASVHPIERLAVAQLEMERNLNFGKIVLRNL